MAKPSGVFLPLAKRIRGRLKRGSRLPTRRTLAKRGNVPSGVRLQPPSITSAQISRLQKRQTLASALMVSAQCGHLRVPIDR